MEKLEIIVEPLSTTEVDVNTFVRDLQDLAEKHGVNLDDISVEPEKTFPVDGAILILLGFASKVAYDVWKEFILPELKEKYLIKTRR